MVSPPAKRAPANFRDDVASATNREAEELVFDYFARRHWCRLDQRHKKVHWDGELHGRGGLRRFDVKADSWVDKYHRAPFEIANVYPDGFRSPGWGPDEKLDILALVAIPSHRCWFIDMAIFRRIVAETPAHARRDWKEFARDNGSYVTEGVAVPLSLLEQHDAILHFARLPEGDLYGAGRTDYGHTELV